MKFHELSLAPEILAGVDGAGFEECTEVQERAIPYVLENRDVMVQSQTGTGKTAAFLLPTYQLLLHDERYRGSRALIVAPTRELAVQIKEESDLLSEGLPLTAEVFHGGVGYHEQEKALDDGVQILVGTPGRILDLSQTGKMPLKEVRVVIIDEADRLFDMGFYPDIRRMMRRMVPREERLNMLFSATLSTRVRNIAWEYMNTPQEIEVQPEHITVERVQQELYHVASEEKMSLMLGILKRDNPRNAIVFTNTKRMAEEIAKRLEINGYPTEFIVGDLPQKKRLSIIRKLKAGETEYLVATDVAARGLHVDNLELVINFDLPEDPEAYVHRIGRTARAGESGKAVSFACQRYVFGLESIEQLINQKIPTAHVSDELMGEDASAGMRIQLVTTGRDGDRGFDGGGGGGGRGRDGRRSSGGGRDGRRGRDDRGPRDGGRPPRRDEERGDGARRDGPPRPRRPVRREPGEDRRPPRSRAPEAASAGGRGPRKGDTLEQRLAYYREKYGEDFQPTDEMLANLGAESDRGRGRRPAASGGESGERDGGDGGAPRKRRRRGGRGRSKGGENTDRGNESGGARPDQDRGAKDGATPPKGGGAARGAGGSSESSRAAQPAPQPAPGKGLGGILKRLFGGGSQKSDK